MSDHPRRSLSSVRLSFPVPLLRKQSRFRGSLLHFRNKCRPGICCPDSVLPYQWPHHLLSYQRNCSLRIRNCDAAIVRQVTPFHRSTRCIGTSSVHCSSDIRLHIPRIQCTRRLPSALFLSDQFPWYILQYRDGSFRICSCVVLQFLTAYIWKSGCRWLPWDRDTGRKNAGLRRIRRKSPESAHRQSKNIGFTPGQCPMELYCPNTCHGPAMFHFIIPLHTKTAQNRSTPYLIQPVGTFLPLFFEFECRFFAPAFRNRFFSLFPANHRKSCSPEAAEISAEKPSHNNHCRNCRQHHPYRIPDPFPRNCPLINCGNNRPNCRKLRLKQARDQSDRKERI